jgi:hypothetical protein
MNIHALIQQFHHPTVTAIALYGSHARGDAGPNSDIDLIRFLNSDEADPPGSGSHLIDDTLVVVSNYTPSTVASWFTAPTAAVTAIAPLRQAKALWDPTGALAQLQARAHAFTWTAALQQQADQWASEELVGWIEEVHKGLEGLRRNDDGRLLNATFGLSWGITGIVKVQRGVLVYSDNTLIDQVMESVGQESRWSQLCRTSFGMTVEQGAPPSLRERVVAGLHLYGATVELLHVAIQPNEAPLIARTVERINNRALLS